jgi:Tfp pilus assembly protein PilE
MNKPHKKDGITLVELLTIVSILAVIAAVVATS